ncbi:MAG: helix-turn-helix transcriptional regulator [Propionicimonas sp.]
MVKIPRGHRMSPLDHDPEALQWALDKSGMKQKDFADAIGKSQSLVSEMLRGTRNATPEVIQRMAEVLNCPRTVLERKRYSAESAA